MFAVIFSIIRRKAEWIKSQVICYDPLRCLKVCDSEACGVNIWRGNLCNVYICNYFIWRWVFSVLSLVKIMFVHDSEENVSIHMCFIVWVFSYCCCWEWLYLDDHNKSWFVLSLFLLNFVNIFIGQYVRFFFFFLNKQLVF